MSQDCIQLRALELTTRIGVHPWERRVHQRLLLELELPVDSRLAARSDALADALDYSAVAETARAHARERDCQLLETLAEELAQRLLMQFDLPWIRLALEKPGAVPDGAPVRLAIERLR